MITEIGPCHLLAEVIKNDIDGTVSIAVFDYEGPLTIVNIMKDRFYEDGSGFQLTHHKEGNAIEIYLNIPSCGHHHDCCGCVCSATGRFTIHGDYLIMTYTTQRNV